MMTRQVYLRFVSATAGRCSGLRCLAMVALFLLSLPACVSQSSSTPKGTSRNASGQRALVQRADKLWAARKARDCKAIFHLEVPPKSQEIKEADYVTWCENEDAFRVVQYTIGKDAEVDQNLGWVRVQSKTAFTAVPSPELAHADSETETVEKWYIVDGQWYPVPKGLWNTVPEPPSQRNALEEERLQARFAESWAALQAKDWQRLYQLVDPPDRIAESAFVSNAGATIYLEHRLIWVEVLGERGTVRVTYKHKPGDPSMTKVRPEEKTVSEFWVNREGEWYRDLKRP